MMTITQHITQQTRPRAIWLALCLAIGLVGSAGITGCAGNTPDPKTAKEAHFHYQLATNHFAAGEVPQAMRELDITLKMQPDHAEALHLMGFVYMGRRQYLEAVRYFKQSLALKPDYHICLNNLGVAYLYLERWDEAAAAFEQLTITTLYTSPWLAYANLGWAYYKQARLAEAIEQTEMALFLNPKMCLASNNLGMMYADRAVFDKAQLSLQDAIEHCPDYAEPHLHLGKMLAERGDTRTAKTHFQACLKLASRSPIGERCRQYTDVMR
jgi:type IV pilus assembly protein PilF